MMKKIIFDCDNTMGLEKKDVDDGLVLLYLLGRDDIKLTGVTSVFGNGTVAESFQTSKDILNTLNVKDVNVYYGAKDSSDIDTEAAEYLVRVAGEHPGEVTLLATGALSNLKAAYYQDNSFFKNLKEIVLMGGLIKSLIFDNKEVEELNFSCDEEAAELVLSQGLPLTVMTGNICLQAFFGEEELRTLKKKENKIYEYIYTRIIDWYHFGLDLINQKGFYMWDLVSAVYVTNPELFESKYYQFISQEKGRLNLKESNDSLLNKVNLPVKIRNVEKMKDIIFKGWKNLIKPGDRFG